MKKTDILCSAFLAAALVLSVQISREVLAGNASTPTRTANYVAGTTIDPAVVNADINALYSELQGNVGTANILDNAITNAKLGSGAVTYSKITGNGNTSMFLRGDATWAAPASVVPTGTIMIWPTDTAPTSWIFANGEAISRTTYASLFSVISTTYGTGDGSTTFNTPDLCGRIAIGSDDMGGITAKSRITNAGCGIVGTTLAAVGGSQLLSAHTHSYSCVANNYYGVDSSVPSANVVKYESLSSLTSGSTGTGTHGVVQPGIVLNYIIRY